MFSPIISNTLCCYIVNRKRYITRHILMQDFLICLDIEVGFEAVAIHPFHVKVAVVVLQTEGTHVQVIVSFCCMVLSIDCEWTLHWPRLMCCTSLSYLEKFGDLSSLVGSFGISFWPNSSDQIWVAYLIAAYSFRRDLSGWVIGGYLIVKGFKKIYLTLV